MLKLISGQMRMFYAEQLRLNRAESRTGDRHLTLSIMVLVSSFFNTFPSQPATRQVLDLFSIRGEMEELKAELKERILEAQQEMKLPNTH
ncbi:hypothetical protein SADUNF_Sadunf09G0124000 [Salix dunnii]|uniref:Uncharacterized protein n=1 Tax=Salix dunnii TaxID=1413687 RepID=A0A835MST5_9ROSI|nr:hypothetical protein SADUNF_Sadunf09G0124000 [Salix dunnii]